MDETWAQRCREELKNQGIRGEIGRRLQALISAHEHGITVVARVYGISRETLMRWIRAFQQSGCAGFAVAPGRGVRPKLSPSQLQEIKQYVEVEGKHLTARRLQAHIQARYSLSLGIATIYRIFQKLGFSWVTGRPSHYRKDPHAQEVFKKKSSA